MISLTIWFCLWSGFFVVAPPSWNTNHSGSLENISSITSNLSNTNTKMFIKRRKTTTNHTKTIINPHQFDINVYRSSWKFVDKNTIRIRFRLYESLLSSIVSTRFLVRHTHTGHIQIYNEPHETMNSTLTLYLHNLKHGRHTVCLLIYTSKLIKNPKHILCQDIIFNFQKYGHHDIDSDEYGNTFVFLLTQYSIVVGILCILQLVHATRKRRFLQTVYDKANALRNLMIEHHHRPQENKSTTHLNNHTHALEYLIYNLNRNAVYNFDQMYMQTINEEDDLPISSHQKGKHLELPNRLNEHSTTALLRHRRSIPTTTINDDDLDLNEKDFDTQSYEEQQSTSLKSVSHILEANKPWMTKLTDHGGIEHVILSSAPLQDTRTCTL